jgi:DnaK suppressor protein
MNVQHYKDELLRLEKSLSVRLERGNAAADDLAPDSPGDTGDASVRDLAMDERLRDAELDGNVLAQVRDALQRIADGTYGKCAVDGGPIEKKRLDAVPWSPYCIAHAESLEGDAGRPATL